MTLLDESYPMPLDRAGLADPFPEEGDALTKHELWLMQRLANLMGVSRDVVIIEPHDT